MVAELEVSVVGRPSRKRIALFAALGQTSIAVATSFIAKATLKEMPAMAVLMLRLAGASTIFVALFALKGVSLRGVPRRDVLAMVGLGLLGVTLNQACFIGGLAESTPSRSSLLYAMTPLCVLGLGALRGTEALTRAKLVGILVALGGVVLILSHRDDLAGASLRGDLILVGGVIAWAAYSALGKPVLQHYDAFMVTGVVVISGTLAFAPLGLYGLSQVELGEVSAQAWMGIAFMATISSVAAYLLWFFAIRHLPASQVAIFMNLQPPLVVLVSFVVFQQPVTLLFLGGALLVLLGVRVATSN
jgi:drug/metabolite transporter (DMT)-like permease